MNAMTNISNEIFANIFYNLLGPDLKQCLYVSKQWNHNAAQCYYDTVTLSNNQRAFLDALVCSENSQTPIGHWVRKLVFKQGSYSAHLNIYGFQQLISCLPCLKIIQFNSRSYALEYLNYLLQIDDIHLNNWREIKLDIPNIKDDHVIYDIYAKVMLKLCNTITRLTLENFAIDPFHNNETNLLKYLSVLSSLKSLSISNRRGIDIHHLDIAAILETCPTLRTFELRSYVNNCDNTRTNTSQYQCTTGLRYLEKLHLSLCQLDTSFMQYMMTRIPATKSLFLRIYGTSFNDWMNDDQIHPSLVPFADYLSDYPDLTMSMATGVIDNGLISHAKPSELLRSSTNALWDFCSRIKGDRDMFGDVIIELEHTRHVHIKPLISVKEGHHIKLWTPLSKEPAYDWDSYFSSQKDLLFINSLQINHCLDMDLLSCLIKQCKRLKHLYFENKNESILLGPLPSDLHGTHLEYRKKYQQESRLSTTRNNLELGSLYNMLVTDDILQRLPKLHTLQLLQCKLDRSVLVLKQDLARLDIVLDCVPDDTVAFKVESLKSNRSLTYRYIANSSERRLLPVSCSDEVMFTIKCSSVDEISIRVPIKDTEDVMCLECHPYLD